MHGAISTANAAEYETITVAAGEAREHRVGSGETFENKLIDQTADGASFKIIANGDDWTIRNVGFKGIGDEDALFHISPSGDGLIENVFMEGWGTSLGGIFVRAKHSGQLDVRHTHIAGFGNNAVYASGVGKKGHDNGATTFENCYHRDNTVAQFRIGAPGSYIRNCVAIANDPDGRRGTYPGSDTRGSRGIWARHHPDQRVENTTVYVSPDDVSTPDGYVVGYDAAKSNGPHAELTIDNCDVNPDASEKIDARGENERVNVNGLTESPTVEVLQNGGVPLSAEMAARGDRQMPNPPALPDPTG